MHSHIECSMYIVICAISSMVFNALYCMICTCHDIIGIILYITLCNMHIYAHDMYIHETIM